MWLEGRLGIDRDKAVRVVMTFPLILSMGLETMDWKIVWLQQRLGLTKDQMTALIVKYPNLLSYNIEDNIEPTLKWLEEGLGVDAGVAGKLVLRQPRLLSASLEDNLKKKVCVHVRVYFFFKYFVIVHYSCGDVCIYICIYCCYTYVRAEIYLENLGNYCCLSEAHREKVDLSPFTLTSERRDPAREARHITYPRIPLDWYLVPGSPNHCQISSTQINVLSVGFVAATRPVECCVEVYTCDENLD